MSLRVASSCRGLLAALAVLLWTGAVEAQPAPPDPAQPGPAQPGPAQPDPDAPLPQTPVPQPTPPDPQPAPPPKLPDPLPKLQPTSPSDQPDVVTGAGKDVRPPPPRSAKALSTPSVATRLAWKWPTFTGYQLGLTIAQGGLAVASVAIPKQINWRDSNGFDDAVRDGLRLTDRESSLYARDFSDVGLVLLLNQQLVDTLFVTWWYHDKGSTALQMALLDVQTISFSAGLNSMVAGLVGRERPYARALCNGPIDDEGKSSDCLSNNRYRSFFSGHTTAAFTLAALTCVHHINLPLYGGGPAEAIPCATSMMLAAGVGLLRVASDQHYFSDILVGAAFGTAVGFAVPYMFHYAHTKDRPNAALRALGVTNLSIGPQPAGLQLGGMF